jgi:hypothetical protein
MVQSQPGQTVLEALSQKNPSQKKGWFSGLRCRLGLKPQYCKKKISCLNCFDYQFPHVHEILIPIK